MKKSIYFAALLLAFASCGRPAHTDLVERSFQRAVKQYEYLAGSMTSTSQWPYTLRGDTLFPVSIHNWTVGFFPGSLWYIYEYTQDLPTLENAKKWTESLEENQWDTTNHDIGFEMYCSYGNGLRLTGDVSYEPILIESAKSLCKRFSPTVGCILSWNPRTARNGVDRWEYPVIIDNMMNLELLFYATRVTGDSTYYNIAVSHADKTMKEHFRPDMSTYHVVDYDPQTGQVAHKQTQQGFADNSTWARGQSWALYGFTMSYRCTGKPEYLATAIGAANFMLDLPTMPADGIPVWDYNVGEPGFTPVVDYTPEEIALKPRDASAAAIAASAMLELSGYCDGEQKRKLFDGAEKILASLGSDAYLAAEGENRGFLLMHSTANMPGKADVDVPLNYADYYFLEALLRYDALTRP